MGPIRRRGCHARATKPGQTWEKEEGQLRLDTCHLTVVNCPELNYLLNKPMQDLEGITVVSVEQAVAAPYASGRLAQAGARVIKAERPEGDFARRYDSLVNGDSAYFVWLNHGKESICIDLKQADEKSLLQKLIASADVFIQNLAPGAAKRLGFGAEELQQRYPSLIYCSISGFGETGPYAQQKAYDLLIQAESGLCAINSTPDGPARVGVSVCDIAAGMTAYQSILQALFARERDKKKNGRIINVSLYHALADWMNVPYLQYKYGNRDPGRQGLKHPTIAPYGAYPCADDKFLLISIQNEREWSNLCNKVLNDPELTTATGFANNTDRVANRSNVDSTVAAAFVKRDRDSNIKLLETAGIAYGRLSDLDDLISHPQNKYLTINGQAGPVELLAPDGRDGSNTDISSVPALDQHGESIRAEFS